MEHQGRTVDEIIAAMASCSHGVVTRKELLGKGMTVPQIRRRLNRGSLIPVHRGVYRVGHAAPSAEADYLAAVLACGDGALLCGRAAGYLWGLIRGARPAPEVRTRTERRVEGVRVRRARPHFPEDAGRRRGIPVTKVQRTLVDLAGVLSEPVLGRACHEAEVRYEVTPDQVEKVLSRIPNARGARTLRRILHGDIPIALSRLELNFLRLLGKASLPLPETNRRAGGYRVDCRWPAHRLTVELDSYRYHGTRSAWERDRHREREAYARGDQFRRYTWRDVETRSRLLLRELRALLAGNPA
jgi:hypothetical protein